MQVSEIVSRYFPQLNDEQIKMLNALPSLYAEWNEKINVISRKDIDNFVVNHLWHSMSIALFTSFKEHTSILDVGTGGGLPGIPLAILFPKCSFTLVDSIGKKVKVTQSIAEEIGLKNTTVLQARAETLGPHSFHFLVSRAAMPMKGLVEIGERVINKKEQNNTHKNGIIALKGGDLTEELKPFRKSVKEVFLGDMLSDEPFFETKKIIYYPL